MDYEQPTALSAWRARLGEMIESDARADMTQVEPMIESSNLDQEEQSALWLWAWGHLQRVS